MTTFPGSHKSRTNPVKSKKLLYFEKGLSIMLFPFLLLWHLAAIKTVKFFRNPWQIFCLRDHALIFHLWLMITVFHSFCDWLPFLGECIFPLYIYELYIQVEHTCALLNRPLSEIQLTELFLPLLWRTKLHSCSWVLGRSQAYETISIWMQDVGFFSWFTCQLVLTNQYTVNVVRKMMRLHFPVSLCPLHYVLKL